MRGSVRAGSRTPAFTQKRSRCASRPASPWPRSARPVRGRQMRAGHGCEQPEPRPRLPRLSRWLGETQRPLELPVIEKILTHRGLQAGAPPAPEGFRDRCTRPEGERYPAEGTKGRRSLAGPSKPDRSAADLNLHSKTDSSASGGVFRPTLPSARYRREGKEPLKSLPSHLQTRINPVMAVMLFLSISTKTMGNLSFWRRFQETDMIRNRFAPYEWNHSLVKSKELRYLASVNLA
jgi:hypothetical protein